MRTSNTINTGFTLIELSIVLVIIGLIIGGILTGQDLINAAAQRAQIAQIEKYNTAVHAFQNKYGYLPGDMPNPQASNFGFHARGTVTGQGDGNGIIQTGAGGWVCGCYQGGGETGVFWSDLGTAGLIDANFILESETGIGTTIVSSAFPQAKIGQGNYVYVWSGGPASSPYNGSPANGDSTNYYGVSAITSMNTSSDIFANPGISVLQANNIDSKIDDGLPQSGNVIAVYVNYNTGVGSAGVSWAGTTSWAQPPYTTATAGSATSCFDNSATSNGTPGVTGAVQHYSLEISSGTNLNCALSFRFQ